MGFVCLSEFSKRRCCCACWVSANPLCRLAMTSLPSAPTLRSPHRRRAANNSLRHTAILSQALAPLQSLAHVTPRHSIVSRQQMPRAPSRVSSPSAFSQPQRATQRHRPVNAGPEDSHLFGPLRPQGFSPSRRLSPLTTCWACFIPVPLMGFSLRGFHPPNTPYALESAAPLGTSSVAVPVTAPTALQGLTRIRKPGTRPGVNQVAGPYAPLGFSAPRFLAIGGRGGTSTTIPSRTLPTKMVPTHGPGRWCLRVFTGTRRNLSLSRQT
jgi:hypothetical protein